MINRASLLTALVGPEGAAALAKAAERLPQIDNAMAPRALFSWLSLAADGYEGDIPGIDGSHLALKKSTRGFGGAVSVGAAGYEFEDASLLHVSAAIGVLGGIDGHRVDSRVSDDSLYRLGQTVDMLVKARSAHQSLLKSRDDIPAYDFEHEYDASQDPPVTTIYAFDKGKEVAKVVVAGAEGGHKIRSWTVDGDAHPTLETRLRDVVAHVTGSDLGKADPEGSKDRVDSPGPAHKPTAPAEPIPPDAPTNKAQQPSVQRGKKMGLPRPTPTTIPGLRLKLSEKQLSGQCPKCDGYQMSNGQFTGCWCFRDLGRFVRMAKSEKGVSLSLGAEWTEDAVLALLDSTKGRP